MKILDHFPENTITLFDSNPNIAIFRVYEFRTRSYRSTMQASPNLISLTGSVFLSVRYPLSPRHVHVSSFWSQLHFPPPAQLLVIPHAHFPLSTAAPPGNLPSKHDVIPTNHENLSTRRYDNIHIL